MKRTVNYLKRMRIWAIFAFVCSLFLASFFLYQSSLTAEESAKYSNFVKDMIKEVFKVEEDIVAPQKLEFYTPTGGNYYFTNEKIKLPLSATPEYADRTVVCEFSADGCMQEGNYFYYTGTDARTITVTVRSVHNPEVKAVGEFILRGINPTDECVEKVKTTFVGDNNREYTPDELKVGMRYGIRISLIIKDEYLEQYGLTEKELVVPSLPYRLLFDGEDRTDLYQFDSWDKKIVFYGATEGDLTLALQKSATLFFDDIEGHAPVNQLLSVKVTLDEAYYQKCVPTAPLKPSVGVYDAATDEYVITVTSQERINIYGTGGSVPSYSICRLEFRDEESKKTASLPQRYVLTRKVNFGTCYLDMVSIFDENIRTKIRVEFEGNMPTKLTAYGKTELTCGGSDRYTFTYDKRLYDQNRVEWKIIEGADRAELNGARLTAKWFGTVVLRAQSPDYPELYHDIHIEVKLITSLNLFVRKFIGHFLLFAAFGGVTFVAYFFFIKKRWVSYLCTPLTIVGLAGLTEWIQGMQVGRYALLSDVFVNSLGGILGMLAVAGFGLIYALIVKKRNPQKYGLLKQELSKMSFIEAFRKTKAEEDSDTKEEK